jgi:hypothetical protein
LDGSGNISAAEQSSLFTAQGIDVSDPAVQAQMATKFEKLDRNGDGRVVLVEYMAGAGFEEQALRD